MSTTGSKLDVVSEMTAPPNISDLLVEQGTQLGRIEGRLEALNQRLDGLVTSSEFEARMSAVEATLATNQWWFGAVLVGVPLVLGVLQYLQRRPEKTVRESKVSGSAEPEADGLTA